MNQRDSNVLFILRGGLRGETRTDEEGCLINGEGEVGMELGWGEGLSRYGDGIGFDLW